MKAIIQDGKNNVKIDLGKINCMGEPYVFHIGDQEIIMRYDKSAREEDYGKMTLEAVTKHGLEENQ